jgi:hypothetical protein
MKWFLFVDFVYNSLSVKLRSFKAYVVRILQLAKNINIVSYPFTYTLQIYSKVDEYQLLGHNAV